MIGWVHITLSTLISRSHGQEVLLDVLQKAGYGSEPEFEVQTYYDDADTMKLFRVAATVLSVSVDDMWQLYGDFLVVYASETGWEKMLQCLAGNLQEFLDNMNSMHYFIDQIAFKSEMRGPTFKCESTSDGSLRLHYFSNRQGLYPIVKGLVSRVARMLFALEVKISVLERTQERRKSGLVDHVIFVIEPPDGEEGNRRHNNRFRKEKNVHESGIEADAEAMGRLPLCLRDFNHIFPYHICFNKQMVIEHVGVFLLNEYGLADKKAMKLTDLVHLIQPSDVQLTFKNILAYMNTLFIFQMKLQARRSGGGEEGGGNSFGSHLTGTLAQPLSLKGQMLLLHGGNSCLLLCSPYVTTVRNILDMRLFISDMPMHDATRDLVMLNQSRICQMELNKRLEETSRKMRGFAEELEKKKAQTDHLLFEFVPLCIADSLRQHKPVMPQIFTEATVLYSDLPDFISIHVHCKPADMVDLLSDLFHRFDRLIQLHKVYKVLALMDSYLVVGGVPSNKADHCESVLNLALGMVFEARQVIVPELDLPLRLRIGIAGGPVIAGVVSQKKPRYCVLGETVMTAKIINAHCDSGKILVANNVRTNGTKSLRSVFVFSSKGYIDTGAHKTLTHFLERNEKLSVWDIVKRGKEADQSIDGYKELHSQEGAARWEMVKQDVAKQQQVVDALRSGPSSTARAINRLLSIKRAWRFRSNRSADSGISVGSRRSEPESAVCSLQ